MSLILEALRKSEEQRKLGQAPDLAADTAWAARRRYTGAAPRSRAWLVLAPVALAAIAGGAWFFMSARDASAPVADAPVATDTPATPVPPAAAPATPTTPAATPPRAPALAGARDATRVPAPPPAAAPVPTEPTPAGVADPAAAREAMAPAMREKFERGEVFANSPELLTPKAPTTETPYVPPEAALPAPLPDAENTDAAKAVVATPAPPAGTAPPTAMAATPVPPPAATPSAAATMPSGAPAIASRDAAPAATMPTPPPPPAAIPGEPLPMGRNPVVAGYEPPVPAIFELPLETRRNLPPLRVIMHVWAETPAQRFVVIDEVRAGEGQPLAKGVDVVEIRTDGVVLSYNGQRFLLPRTGR